MILQAPKAFPSVRPPVRPGYTMTNTALEAIVRRAAKTSMFADIQLDMELEALERVRVRVIEFF